MNDEPIQSNEEKIPDHDVIVLGKEFHFLLNEEDAIYDELYGDLLRKKTGSETRGSIPGGN